jgi:hypothetical protein
LASLAAHARFFRPEAPIIASPCILIFRTLRGLRTSVQGELQASRIASRRTRVFEPEPKFWITIGLKFRWMDGQSVYFWMHLGGTTGNLANGANLRIREDGNA